MADQKISGMTTASALTGAESLEVVQGGVNKKTTAQDIANLGGVGGTQDLASVLTEGNSAGGDKIVDLGTPTDPTDAATKGYVDGVIPTGVVESVNGDDGPDVSLAAVNIPFTPAGDITAEDVQAAIEQVATFSDAGNLGDIVTLTDAAPVVVDAGNIKEPKFYLETGTSRTLSIVNLRGDGALNQYSASVFLIKKTVAGDITITLDSSFTNRDYSTDATVTEYVLSGADESYFKLSFYLKGESSGANIWWSLAAPAGSGGGSVSDWGYIGGTLSDQTDLQSALDAKFTTASASESAQGIAELATSAETITGSDDLRIVTPLKLKNKLSSNIGKTDSFATVQSDNQKVVILNAATAKTVTVDQLTADSYMTFLNIGLGQWNFTPGAGVSALHGAGSSLAGGDVTSITLWWLSATEVYIFSGVSNTVSSLAVTGSLAIKAGLSAGTIAKVGGVVYTNVTAVGNVLTGEDDLFIFTVPANTLAADKSSLVAIAAGTFAANANNKRIRVKFGGTNLIDTTALALNAGDWTCEVQIFRTAGSAQKCITTIRSSNALLTSIVDYVATAQDLSTDLELKLTAEATATNDIVAEVFKVRFEPNE